LTAANSPRHLFFIFCSPIIFRGYCINDLGIILTPPSPRLAKKQKMANPYYDDKGYQQWQVRATGQLYLHPQNRGGNDSSHVIEATVQDLDFGSSVDADRFMDHQRRRYARKSQLMNQRRFRQQASVSSD
jgi:hypothetical protein